MRRKLTLVEGTMYGDGQTAVNAVVAAKIKGSVDIEDLQLALLKVQARHPLLNVNVREDETGIPYFITNENIGQIPVRISNRYTDEDWEKQTSVECLTPFDAKSGPLMRVVYLKSPEASNLIMVCHHCICDGRAILTLLDETLRLLAEPQTDIGTYQAFSSLCDFIPDRARKSRKNLLMVFLVKKLSRLMLLAVASKKEIKRVKPYLIHWRINEQESAAILSKCRKQGISLHAVLSVIFLKAYDTIETIKPYKKLYCAVDMRKFVPEIKNDMLFAFPAMIELGLKGECNIGFWDQVRLFKEELALKISKTNVNRIFLLDEGLSAFLPKLAKYAKVDAGAHDFTFSNMGNSVIQENYGLIEVQAVYSPVTIFPFGNPSTFFASSFRGQLDFMMTSDVHFLKYEDAILIREKTMELLKEMN
ncbi:condensation domain-containing protein [Pedobacter cryoconitis]|uniref:condensation domain-containing protein n=1 Tax=Pedobacter cryoconitis TaxID=188932 RepID=UPI00160E8CA2|nr:condensation domain-containing protein [Pedobacter cryoconitis]MBB5646221.1 NRPS condensation-like uncharacterized protein [Pedobacter cryoconitis]